MERPAQNLAVKMIPGGLPLFTSLFAEFHAGTDVAEGDEPDAHFSCVRIPEPGAVLQKRQRRITFQRRSAAELPAVASTADAEREEIFALFHRQEEGGVIRGKNRGVSRAVDQSRSAEDAVDERFKPPITTDAEQRDAVAFRLEAIVEYGFELLGILSFGQVVEIDHGVEIDRAVDRDWSSVPEGFPPFISDGFSGEKMPCFLQRDVHERGAVRDCVDLQPGEIEPGMFRFLPGGGDQEECEGKQPENGSQFHVAAPL